VNGIVAVADANDGQTVTLHPGNQLRVALASTYWQIQPSSDPSVLRADGSVETYAVVTALDVNDDDVIRIHTGGGGGYGDPRRRPADW